MQTQEHTAEHSNAKYVVRMIVLARVLLRNRQRNWSLEPDPSSALLKRLPPRPLTLSILPYSLILVTSHFFSFYFGIFTKITQLLVRTTSVMVGTDETLNRKLTSWLQYFEDYLSRLRTEVGASLSTTPKNKLHTRPSNTPISNKYFVSWKRYEK
jgi:hypothetical protein